MKPDHSVIRTLALGAACFALCLGCSDDNEPAGSGTGGTAGTGGSGGSGGATPACPEAESAGCDVSVAPSDDDTFSVQTALIDVKSDSTLCVCPGTYSFKKELSLTRNGVTVRGLGAEVEDTVFDFATQVEGDDGFLVTSDGFTIENLWVKNSPGNGIVVDGAEDVVFRKLKVSWDAGSATENGAYAVYPVSSKRVLVEDTVVIGAADAGIYVGQCQDVIVRRNLVHDNVMGIEIENSINAEVYENEAHDNTTGIAVFVLPNLKQKVGHHVLVHDNNSHDNNHENFGEAGTIVSNVPVGIGFAVLAADQVELRDNTAKNNNTGGILLLSLAAIGDLLGTKPDPDTNGYSEEVFVHNNTFMDNGKAPSSLLGEYGVVPMEDVVWDGSKDPASTAEALCLGDPPLPSFRNLNAPDGGLFSVAKHTTDATPYQCKLTPLPGVTF